MVRKGFVNVIADLPADPQATEPVQVGGWVGRAVRCPPWQVLFPCLPPNRT